MFCRERQYSVTCCLALTLCGIACSETTALPSGNVQYSAPPPYELWWSLVEACSGRTASLADVKWYVVPGVDTISDGTDEVSGYWSSDHNRVVLAGNLQYNGPLVRHEMLHALLRNPSHSRNEFLDRCAGVVHCGTDCLKDAGTAPEPDADTPRVPPDSIDLGIELTPITPGVNTFSGYFTLAVTARNAADHPVIVTLQPPRDGNPSVSFTCQIIGQGSNLSFTEWAWDPAVTYFAAGETKRMLFDLAEGTSPGVANIGLGTFTLRAAFGERHSLSQSMVLTP
jgi:hypothetical protein